jgi:hypothetical protein
VRTTPAAKGGEGVAVLEDHGRCAVGEARREVDAELLDDVACDFGDGDLQHHLVAAAHDDGVDHLVRTAGEPGGDIAGLLRLELVGGHAAQHDAIAKAVDLDLRVRHDLLQHGACAIEVALHRDVIGGDLLAGGIEEHDVGLADRGADDVGALRRTDHGIGDLGIGDQHVLDVARQVDDDGFADAERQETRVALTVGGGGRGADAVVAGERRRRHGLIEHQRRDCRKRQGAGRQAPQR